MIVLLSFCYILHSYSRICCLNGHVYTQSYLTKSLTIFENKLTPVINPANPTPLRVLAYLPCQWARFPTKTKTQGFFPWGIFTLFWSHDVPPAVNRLLLCLLADAVGPRAMIEKQFDQWRVWRRDLTRKVKTVQKRTPKNVYHRKQNGKFPATLWGNHTG